MNADCEHDRLKQEGYTNCGKCGEELARTLGTNDLFSMDRRVKLLRIPAAFVLNCVISPLLRRGKFINVNIIESLLPEDGGCSVHSADYDPLTGTIGFVIHHTNFPVIPENCHIPVLDITCRSAQIRLTEEQVARLIMDKMVRS